MAAVWYTGWGGGGESEGDRREGRAAWVQRETGTV